MGAQYLSILGSVSFEEGFDVLIGLGAIYSRESPIAQVANVRCKLQAEQIEEGKDHQQ